MLKRRKEASDEGNRTVRKSKVSVIKDTYVENVTERERMSLVLHGRKKSRIKGFVQTIKHRIMENT